MKRNFQIDGDRLWSRPMDIAKIGIRLKGDVARLALTEMDAQGWTWVRVGCEQGWAGRSDSVSNQFAKLEGADLTLAADLMGSHLDTQPIGGRFDGAWPVAETGLKW
jgi:beta-ureidopropionase / N-carbamoyl-L-amino-acid hydrolase